MAQRTTLHSDPKTPASCLLATAPLLTPPQGKKQIPVPLRSRHLASDGAERLIDTLPILIPVLQHRDRERILLISFDQLRAGRRHAGIERLGGRCYANSRLTTNQFPRRAKAQVGIGGDLSRVLMRPLRQTSFGHRLHAPRDTPE